jgi:flavin-dependent dehydrogenase
LRDLLIIGAGPAGCAAAIQARRAGLTVLLLEASERGHPTPGETLHPGIEPIFERLGVRDAILGENFHRHRGVWIEWESPRRFEAYGEDEQGPWHGFQADRRRLNEILREAAVSLGVVLKQSISPQGLITDAAGVKGVTVDGREFYARWTADATGRHAWLARALKSASMVRSPPLLARFGWRDGVDPGLDGQPWIKAEPYGWSWVAPLGGGKSASVSLVAGGAHASTRQSGTDVTWRINPDCAGPGYFFLGDSAALLDPLSSHGVLRAMMSGLLCAHLVAAHRNQQLPAPEVAAQYKSWLTQQFEADVTALSAIYGRHPVKELAALFSAGQQA